MDNSLLWGCPVYCRVFGNLCGISTGDDSSILLIVTTETVSRLCAMLPGENQPGQDPCSGLSDQGV